MGNLKEIVCFVPSKNPRKARRFYEGALGLRFVSEDRFATVVESSGTMVRLVNVKGVRDFRPAPFTILGWHVGDVRKVVLGLRRRGVKFERYDGMGQDRLGIWKSPSGAKVAWFKDPDGNTLSVTE
jgi:catechol 2,3-dioxygenase-like lactoylglutathione lyase family enzyme